MAKGHRSQIKRERNENQKDTRPSAKFLCKNFRTEGLLRVRCHQRQRCRDSNWYFIL